MTKETFSPQEMLEARIGENGMHALADAANGLINHKKLSLNIKDPTLVDPAFEGIKQMIAQFEQRTGVKEPINFIVVDFRQKWFKAGLEELEKLLGSTKIYHDTYIVDQGRKEDNQRAHTHRKKDRLILIDPLAANTRTFDMNIGEAKEEDEAFNKLRFYVKYGVSTLTILVRKSPKSGLPYSVSELVGEYSDWSYFLDYDPYKRDLE